MAELRDDERVWLHHPDTDAWFECPAAAIGAWQARGWQVADPDRRPAEPNPVVEELAAFQAEQAKAAAEAARPAKKAAKFTASSGNEDKE